MIKKFLSSLKIDWKFFLLNVCLFIALFIIGCLLASAFNNDHSIDHEFHSFLDIFINNSRIALVGMLGTIVFAYFIFVFNTILLGMSLYLAFNVYPFWQLFKLFAFHGILEIICWLITLDISRKVTRYYFKKEKPEGLFYQIIICIILYAIAAFIEYMVMLGRG
ncbi:stage II sporulation protein M [Bacillus sp. ISL-8]|nr:stage II sporulation protein M [Bacillus sp. ISL-8]